MSRRVISLTGESNGHPINGISEQPQCHALFSDKSLRQTYRASFDNKCTIESGEVGSSKSSSRTQCPSLLALRQSPRVKYRAKTPKLRADAMVPDNAPMRRANGGVRLLQPLNAACCRGRRVNVAGLEDVLPVYTATWLLLLLVQLGVPSFFQLRLPLCGLLSRPGLHLYPFAGAQDLALQVEAAATLRIVDIEQLLESLQDILHVRLPALGWRDIEDLAGFFEGQAGGGKRLCAAIL